MSGEITEVAKGETFTAKIGDEAVEFTVEPSCHRNNGRWFCVTHNLSFRNQLEKDSHINNEGDHKLAWICFEHGAEVP